MQGDAAFRLVLILGVVFVMPVGVFHRLKAHTAGDKLNRREEGLFILLTLRPLGMAGMIGLLLFVIDPRWTAWEI